MRQIDIMISTQRSEWEAEMQALQLRLKVEREELQTSRTLAQRQDQEVRREVFKVSTQNLRMLQISQEYIQFEDWKRWK